MEAVVTALVLVNALAWGWGLLWLSDHWTPFGRELLSMFRTAISDLQDWLGRH
jgi:hypothetical protein